MHKTSSDHYKLLYELDRSKSQYQPRGSWCVNAHYETGEFLRSKEKSKFIPDEILVTKREFIRDNF